MLTTSSLESGFYIILFRVDELTVGIGSVCHFIYCWGCRRRNQVSRSFDSALVISSLESGLYVSLFSVDDLVAGIRSLCQSIQRWWSRRWNQVSISVYSALMISSLESGLYISLFSVDDLVARIRSLYQSIQRWWSRRWNQVSVSVYSALMTSSLESGLRTNTQWSCLTRNYWPNLRNISKTSLWTTPESLRGWHVKSVDSACTEIKPVLFFVSFMSLYVHRNHIRFVRDRERGVGVGWSGTYE